MSEQFAATSTPCPGCESNNPAARERYRCGRHTPCRVSWCGRPLNAATYSFGDGLGNVYRKCGGGHWTPEPPPPDLAAIDNADAHDFEGFTP